MLKDFKAFIMRGNVIDLAIGVIIGIAFGAVVKSLVDDVIMPPIGLATGGIDFLEQVRGAEGWCGSRGTVRIGGGGEGRGCDDAELWRIRQ